MHDLTYKPGGVLDDRLKSMMEGFGDTLELIELQSGLVRSLIEERWQLDRARKRAARYQLQRTILQNRPQSSDKKANRLREVVLERADALAEVPREDAGLSTLLGQIEALRDRTDDNIVPWLLMLVLAGARGDGALDYDAERYVDRWVLTVPRAEKPRALLTKSFALYCLGETWQALEGARDALKRLHRMKESAAQPLRFNAKANIASYIVDLEPIEVEMDGRLRDEAEQRSAEAEAEFGDWLESRAKTADAATAAHGLAEVQALRRHLREPAPDPARLTTALQSLDQRLRDACATRLPAILDTKGAVTIAFGKEPDIRNGLRWCDVAHQLAADPTQVRAFYQLRERHAWRRLLEL